MDGADGVDDGIEGAIGSGSSRSGGQAQVASAVWTALVGSPAEPQGDPPGESPGESQGEGPWPPTTALRRAAVMRRAGRPRARAPGPAHVSSRKSTPCATA